MATDGRRKWNWETAALGAILLLGLLVRLPFAATDFFGRGDTDTYRDWARLVESRGLAAAYDGGNIDYPPALLYLLGLAAVTETWLDPGENPAGDDRLLLALIKLPAMLADVLTAGLIGLAFRRRGRRAMLGAAALYAFNPAVWLVSTVWGQTDAIYTLFVVAAVLAMQQRKMLPAWLAWTLGMATKLQSIALGPLLIGWSLVQRRRRELATALVTSAAILALLASPWILSGRFQAIARVYSILPDAAPRVDTSAYNLWYLLFLGNVRNASSATGPFGLPISYQTLGVLAFAVFAVVVVMASLTRKGTIALCAATLNLGMFTLLTQMHERYLFPVLALLLLAVAEREEQPAGESAADRPAIDGRQRGLWLAYGILSLTLFYNLATIATFWPLPPMNLVAAAADSPLLIALKELAFFAAALNTALLGWLLMELARQPIAGPQLDSIPRLVHTTRGVDREPLAIKQRAHRK